jgi:hypothetical protein
MQKTIQNPHRTTTQTIKAGIDKVIDSLQSLGLSEKSTVATEKDVTFKMKTRLGMEINGKVTVALETAEIVCNTIPADGPFSEMTVQMFADGIEKIFST